MKRLILTILLMIGLGFTSSHDATARSSGYKTGPGTGSSSRSHSVKGYIRKDGTYVAPHRQSNPDKSFNNNWSTNPNTNPYTGKQGTRNTPPSK